MCRKGSIPILGRFNLPSITVGPLRIEVVGGSLACEHRAASSEWRAWIGERGAWIGERRAWIGEQGAVGCKILKNRSL